MGWTACRWLTAPENCGWPHERLQGRLLHSAEVIPFIGVIGMGRTTIRRTKTGTRITTRTKVGNTTVTRTSGGGKKTRNTISHRMGKTTFTRSY
jgi:hypothetical protein